MLWFVDYIAAKQIIAPALNALVRDPKKVFEASYAQVWEAIRALVKRAIKSGDIRKDLDAIDPIAGSHRLANMATSPDWQQSARRLVDILVTGSRPFKIVRARSADRGASYCAFRGDFVLVVISMAAAKELATASPDANHKTMR